MFAIEMKLGLVKEHKVDRNTEDGYQYNTKKSEIKNASAVSL